MAPDIVTSPPGAAKCKCRRNGLPESCAACIGKVVDIDAPNRVSADTVKEISWTGHIFDMSMRQKRNIERKQLRQGDDQMLDYGEILRFLARNPPQFESERHLHASLLELMAKCLRSDDHGQDLPFQDVSLFAGRPMRFG